MGWAGVEGRRRPAVIGNTEAGRPALDAAGSPITVTPGRSSLRSWACSLAARAGDGGRLTPGPPHASGTRAFPDLPQAVVPLPLPPGVPVPHPRPPLGALASWDPLPSGGRPGGPGEARLSNSWVQIPAPHLEAVGSGVRKFASLSPGSVSAKARMRVEVSIREAEGSAQRQGQGQ